MNPAAQQTVYAEDGEGSTVLGQYSNRRSSNSSASAGEMDSTEIIYLPTAGGPMPVAAQINGRLYAIGSDHLNTPRRLTNEQGQVAWQWLITGFGEVKPTMGAAGYAQSRGGASYSEAVTFGLRYPGQQWDEETGLSYNLNRYYDAAPERYIQSDPIGLDGGWNRFGYVDGNPLSFVDPDGLAPKYEKPQNPNKKPPPIHRVPDNARERNVAHPNAEEHSRTSKGQRGNRGARGARGVGGLFIWDLINNMCAENPGLAGCEPLKPPEPPCEK